MIYRYDFSFMSFPEDIPDSIKISGAVLDYLYSAENIKLIEKILRGDIIFSSALPRYHGKIFFPYPIEKLLELNKEKRKLYKRSYVDIDTIGSNYTLRIVKSTDDVARVSLRNYLEGNLFHSRRSYFVLIGNGRRFIINDFSVLVYCKDGKDCKDIESVFKILGGLGLSSRRSVGYGAFKFVESKAFENSLYNGLLLSKYIPGESDSLGDSIIEISFISGKKKDGKSFGPINVIVEGSCLNNGVFNGELINLKSNTGKIDKHIIGYPFILGDKK